MAAAKIIPRLIVFSSLFPHPRSPSAGVFIRERMFRVGKQVPIVVVSPQAWFPLQGLIRIWKPYFRSVAPMYEIQEGIEVYYPRFFSMPGVFKHLDGLFMALGSYWVLYKLRSRFEFNIIDAHFAYPDGFAAILLGKWFKVPVTITLRGTEVPLSQFSKRRKHMIKAIEGAAQVFSVADALKKHVQSIGAYNAKIRVVGNGVDTTKFFPLEKQKVRAKLGIKESDLVLITVGGLVERKGFHRVIDLLPKLKKKFFNLRYLIVGAGGPEGDMSEQLKAQVSSLNLNDTVKFLGALPSDELKIPLSAADLFVLPTSNEGWANVLLEAMACGLPVVTTDVGGNKEVVNHPDLGITVPFGREEALFQAISAALERNWDYRQIQRYAEKNSWDSRVAVLLEEYYRLINQKDLAYQR